MTFNKKIQKKLQIFFKENEPCSQSIIKRNSTKNDKKHLLPLHYPPFLHPSPIS